MLDNHSFVAGDVYIEQADNGYVFAGSANEPPGRVTLQCCKLQMWTPDPAITHTAFDIRDYRGQISIGSNQFYTDPKVMTLLQKGPGPLDFLLWSSFFYDTKLVVNTEAGMKLYQIGNSGTNLKMEPTAEDEPLPPNTLGKLSAALDDMRRLGELDLRLTHPAAK